MTLKLRPEWERIVRVKIGVICFAMAGREKGVLREATDELIEWLRPYFEKADKHL